MYRKRAEEIVGVFKEEGIQAECVFKPGSAANVRAVSFTIDSTEYNALENILKEFKDLKLRMDHAPEGIAGERVYLW